MLHGITVKPPAKNGSCKVAFKAEEPSLFGTQSDLLGEADPGTLSRNPCGPARFAANVSSTSPWAHEPPQTTRDQLTLF